MGARGSLKIPNHLRPVADGEMAGTAAETVPRVAPNKPAAVARDRELSELWDEIVPQLDETGLVAPSDAAAIELALRHFLMARKAAMSVDKIVTEDKAHSGVKKSPAEAVFRAESMAFLEYAKQLGMTFVARARTPAAKGREDGDANPFQGAAVG